MIKAWTNPNRKKMRKGYNKTNAIFGTKRKPKKKKPTTKRKRSS